MLSRGCRRTASSWSSLLVRVGARGVEDGDGRVAHERREVARRRAQQRAVGGRHLVALHELRVAHAQEGPPEDFVIATGRQESVRRFIELTAQELGWGAMQWSGEGPEETGSRGDTGEVVVRIDPRYFRPSEVETLLGDPTKAKEKLGWTPTTTLEELVAEMLAIDKEEARKEATLKREGFVVVGSMENPPTNPQAINTAGGKG